MKQMMPLALFQSSFPASFHSKLLDEFYDLDDAGGLSKETGSILPTSLLPSVRALTEDPVILSEVRRLMPGRELSSDRCVHLHRNDHPGAVGWHIDNLQNLSISDPIVLVCYFPQDTSPSMGPTEARWGGQHFLGAGPAGTCFAMRHDVEHRGTPNLTRPRVWRIMFKLFYGTDVAWRIIEQQPNAAIPEWRASL